MKKKCIVCKEDSTHILCSHICDLKYLINIIPPQNMEYKLINNKQRVKCLTGLKENTSGS